MTINCTLTRIEACNGYNRAHYLTTWPDGRTEESSLIISGQDAANLAARYGVAIEPQAAA